MKKYNLVVSTTVNYASSGGVEKIKNRAALILNEGLEFAENGPRLDEFLEGCVAGYSTNNRYTTLLTGVQELLEGDVYGIRKFIAPPSSETGGVPVVSQDDVGLFLHHSLILSKIVAVDVCGVDDDYPEGTIVVSLQDIVYVEKYPTPGVRICGPTNGNVSNKAFTILKEDYKKYTTSQYGGILKKVATYTFSHTCGESCVVNEIGLCSSITRGGEELFGYIHYDEEFTLSTGDTLTITATLETLDDQVAEDIHVRFPTSPLDFGIDVYRQIRMWGVPSVYELGINKYSFPESKTGNSSINSEGDTFFQTTLGTGRVVSFWDDNYAGITRGVVNTPFPKSGVVTFSEAVDLTTNDRVRFPQTEEETFPFLPQHMWRPDGKKLYVHDPFAQYIEPARRIMQYSTRVPYQVREMKFDTCFDYICDEDLNNGTFYKVLIHPSGKYFIGLGIKKNFDEAGLTLKHQVYVYGMRTPSNINTAYFIKKYDLLNYFGMDKVSTPSTTTVEAACFDYTGDYLFVSNCVDELHVFSFEEAGDPSSGLIHHGAAFIEGSDTMWGPLSSRDLFFDNENRLFINNTTGKLYILETNIPVTKIYEDTYTEDVNAWWPKLDEYKFAVDVDNATQSVAIAVNPEETVLMSVIKGVTLGEPESVALYAYKMLIPGDMSSISESVEDREELSLSGHLGIKAIRLYNNSLYLLEEDHLIGYTLGEDYSLVGATHSDLVILNTLGGALYGYTIQSFSITSSGQHLVFLLKRVLEGVEQLFTASVPMTTPYDLTTLGDVEIGCQIPVYFPLTDEPYDYQISPSGTELYVTQKDGVVKFMIDSDRITSIEETNNMVSFVRYYAKNPTTIAMGSNPNKLYFSLRLSDDLTGSHTTSGIHVLSMTSPSEVRDISPHTWFKGYTGFEYPRSFLVKRTFPVGTIGLVAPPSNQDNYITYTRYWDFPVEHVKVANLLSGFFIFKTNFCITQKDKYPSDLYLFRSCRKGEESTYASKRFDIYVRRRATSDSDGELIVAIDDYFYDFCALPLPSTGPNGSPFIELEVSFNYITRNCKVLINGEKVHDSVMPSGTVGTWAMGHATIGPNGGWVPRSGESNAIAFERVSLDMVVRWTTRNTETHINSVFSTKYNKDIAEAFLTTNQLTNLTCGFEGDSAMFYPDESSEQNMCYFQDFSTGEKINYLKEKEYVEVVDIFAHPNFEPGGGLTLRKSVGYCSNVSNVFTCAGVCTVGKSYILYLECDSLETSAEGGMFTLLNGKSVVGEGVPLHHSSWGSVPGRCCITMQFTATHEDLSLRVLFFPYKGTIYKLTITPTGVPEHLLTTQNM